MLTAITSWPHHLQLSDPEKTPVVCEQPLRNLPGKRLVCRATWGKRLVLVKLFLHPQSARRHWLREKKGVELLSSNNLATPSLLFSGSLNDATPVLIFEYLPMALTALEQWQQCLDDNQRLVLLKKLISTIAAQHHCGLWQQDIHLDNFLISEEKIYTIDGDGVRCAATTIRPHRSMSEHERKNNLALFFAQLPPQYDHLLPDVLTHYLAQQKTPSAICKNWQAVLHNYLHKVRRQRRHTYVDKAYRSCSEFERHNSFRRVLIYRRDINPTLFQTLADNPDGLFKQATILKDGNSATVAAIHIDGQSWVIKRYNIKNFWHGLKRCWRPTRAWVSWGNAHRLSISNIETPQAIAMVEKRWGPLRLGGYFICAAIEGPSAWHYLLDHQVNSMDKSIIKEQFLALFKLLHQLKITHGDCKASNFLIHNHKIYIIDLDAMTEWHWHLLFARNFHSDRARFIRNWDPDQALQRWFDQHLITP